ncbi:MAG: hypothetical protein FJ102_27175, partial [Deltaproteobacteria bacterium]|nr:hypothetical protein [Deltaproteobacteria bacterium]
MKDTTASRPAPPPGADGFVEKHKIAAAGRGHKLPDFGERKRMFLLAAHPSSWDLCKTSKGWRLVPTLKRLILQAGVNWTRPAKRGEALDSSDLEAKARARFGDTVLTEVDQYLYEAQGAGGPGYFLLWENVRSYSDGAWEMSFDQDGYDLWRWSLVTSGRVEPPRESIVAQRRSRLKRKSDRATRTPHLAQAQAAKAEAEAELAGLEEALAELRG